MAPEFRKQRKGEIRESVPFDCRAAPGQTGLLPSRPRSLCERDSDQGRMLWLLPSVAPSRHHCPLQVNQGGLQGDLGRGTYEPSILCSYGMSQGTVPCPGHYKLPSGVLLGLLPTAWHLTEETPSPCGCLQPRFLALPGPPCLRGLFKAPTSTRVNAHLPNGGRHTAPSLCLPSESNSFLLLLKLRSHLGRSTPKL